MKAKRSLGQNFLVDRSTISKIVNALDLQPADHIIEIGPGRGALTYELVRSGSRVTAIEIDRELAPRLADEFSRSDNFRVVEADILTTDLTSILDNNAPVKVIGNLPYYISTPILQKLAEHKGLFSQLVLMFQREVVERIAAEPGGRDRGFLSVIVQDAFDVEGLFDVPPGAFRPVPKVWSSVVRLEPRDDSFADTAAFRRVVSAGFAQKRKSIFNNLKVFPDAAATLTRAKIDGMRRAETLAVEEWRTLTKAFTESKNLILPKEL